MHLTPGGLGMSYAQLLASVEIFHDLNLEQVKKIEALCKLKKFKKNQIIFEENSPSKEFYVIVEGTVDILLDPNLILDSSQEKQELKTIASLRRGQSFGEVALVDLGVRSASAKAKTRKTKVLQINRNDLMQLMKEDLDLGFIVMQNLAADLCFKIRNTNLRVREALLA